MSDGTVTKSKRDETEEERRARKEKERTERKAREKEEEGKKRNKDETEEERRARKERERAERKAREKAEGGGAEGVSRKSKRDETEEERRARKEKERAERKAREKEEEGKKQENSNHTNNANNDATTERKHKRDETEEERRARKEKERTQRKARERERENEKEKEEQSGGEEGNRKQKKDETEEERRARKERERAERKAREKEEREKEKEREKDDEAVEEEAMEAPRHGPVHLPADGTKQADLAAAMDAENDAIRRAAEETRRVERREERRRTDESREREALERRERRRREREDRKEQRGKEENEVSGGGAGLEGTSALGVAELQRQGYRGQFEKDLARATALRRLVDLDDVSLALFDMPPQSQYDIYIRSFGDNGRAQAAVQAPTEEDRANVEVQAERVRVRTRGVEVPRDLGLYPEQWVNRPAITASEGAVARAEETEVVDAPHSDTAARAHVVDTELLVNFLNRVFPVMRAILDENEGDAASSVGGGRTKSEMQFSSSFSTFCFSATRNRPVVKVLFDPCEPAYLAVLYGQKEEDGPSNVLDQYMSVIVIWNVYSPSSPEKILVSPSLITCMCISPRRPYLLYAGAQDGSLCLWDTREPERNHLTAGRFQRNAFRLPSFSTSWQIGHHAAPIVSVLVAGYNTLVGVRKDEGEQVVSLDASGETYFWVVNEKDQSKGVISEAENGLNMFSAVRLFLASSKNDNHTNNIFVSGDAFAIDFVPADASHYVVATAEGVRHISRFGSVAAPSVFGPSSRFFGHQIAVPSCVRYSPVDSRILVTGYGDGTVRLYLHTDGSPQVTIPVGIHRIAEIRGSGADKWLVWVLDAAGTLYLLDLAKKDKELPVISQALSQADTGICTCFDLPPEGKGETRVIALGFEKGIVQLHTLSDLTQPPSSDRNEHWL